MAAIDGGAGMSSGGITFRPYQKSDLARCASISAEAWPEMSGYAPGADGPLTMQAYVDFNRALANWQEVVCVSGEVVGVLFGRLDRDMTRMGRLRGALNERIVYFRLLIGSYGRIPKRIKLMRKGIADDREKLRNSPESDGEVTYFVVAQGHRGKGLGKALMDRFISHATERDAKRIIVLTTDPGCNWGFYQRYGFEHHSRYREEFTSYITKGDVFALIFTIELPKR